MQFYVDADSGTEVHGWLAPDNPSVIPTIRVQVNGLDVIEVQASELRPEIRDAGMHATGLVGFLVNEHHIENISSQLDIRLFDAQTGIQIYSRNNEAKYLQHKVMYYDFSIAPQSKIMLNMSDKFATVHSFVEKHPFETMTSIINSDYNKSILLNGRPFMNRYIPYLRDKNYFISVLVSDPLEELAERILFIQMLARSRAAHLLPDFTSGVNALMGFLTSLDLQNEKELAAAFRTVNADTRTALMSPMVRILGCNTGEELDHRHLSIALDQLSAADLVGSKSGFPAFRSLLASMLGADVIGNGYVDRSHAVQDLAEKLSRIAVVKNFLELDLNLYSYVEDSLAKGLDPNYE